MNGPVVLAAFAHASGTAVPPGLACSILSAPLGPWPVRWWPPACKRFGRKGIVPAAGLFGLSQLVAA
jgi:hypothetical protein